MIQSLVFYWASNLKKRIKDTVGTWLSVIEDAIPLNQFIPLPLVVYQPSKTDAAVTELPYVEDEAI